MNKQDIVRGYFRAEQTGDVEPIIAACADDVIVREVRRSPARGKTDASAILTDFLKIARRREFDLHTIAQEENVVYAWWLGDVEFRNRAVIYVSGITRFLFGDDGLIREIDIGHVTG